MMRKLILGLSLLMVLAPVRADESIPRDVQNFIDRREGCDHMRGEIPDPGDKPRMREMNREIQKLCKGTDKDLARLKKKYAKSPAMMQRLDEFEPTIEAARLPASPGRSRIHPG